MHAFDPLLSRPLDPFLTVAEAVKEMRMTCRLPPRAPPPPGSVGRRSSAIVPYPHGHTEATSLPTYPPMRPLAAADGRLHPDSSERPRIRRSRGFRALTPYGHPAATGCVTPPARGREDRRGGRGHPSPAPAN